MQERLFPKQMPVLPGATLAGHCRPASGVAVKSYDVFDLGEARTGLAIGDVSGKGISAALLMASLRASLRGVTLDNPRDFANLMDKVNRLVFETSASNRYAAFFFAASTPPSQAGSRERKPHPPILLPMASTARRRAPPRSRWPGRGSAAPRSLHRTIHDADARRRAAVLHHGISEAMTNEDEEWGEERMIASAEKVKDKAACEILGYF